MKLIIAIVNNEDSAVVAAALTKDNFTVTKLSTFLIGTEDDRVDRAKEIIARHCSERIHKASTTESFGRGFSDGALGSQVKVGGAAVFVLDVEEAEKY